MKKLLIAIIFTLLPLTPLWAVKMTSLYKAEIPVNSQSDEARVQAVKQGLIQVLIKVSGNPAIEENATIRARLQKAENYLQEYSYESSSLPDTPYLLELHYDVMAVNRLLKNMGAASWGEHRPLILVWLAMTTPEQPAEIVGDEASNDIQSTMKQSAKKYGLPLIFPAMDMADISQVSVENVLSASLPALKKAGMRYKPDAFLIGQVNAKDDFFQGQWQLVLDNNQWSWTLSDKSMANMLTTLLHEISRALAQHYTISLAKVREQWIRLEVTDVAERSDFSSLMQFLKQLTPVEQVQLSKVSGNVVELEVLIRGSIETFQQSATVEQHLNLQSQDPEKNKLVYQWMP